MEKQKKLKFTINETEKEIMDLAAFQINYLTELLKEAPLIFPDNSGVLFEAEIQQMIEEWIALTITLID